MPRAKESLKVDIEQSTDGDVRTVMVTLTVPARDFLLPDLLSEQGAIDPYEVTLRDAVKGATEGYLRGAQDAVAAIAARKQGSQAPAPARSPKEPEGSKVGKPKRAPEPEEAASGAVSRPVPERVNGSVAA